jgi:hypothetical protein
MKKNFQYKLPVLLALYVCGVPSLSAQQAQYLPGQFGLNAGVMPDPGFTYSNITVNYSAQTLKDANGNTVPAKGSFDLWVVENMFFYVPNFTVLGGKMVFAIYAPTLANGSVTEETLGVKAGGVGVADIAFQPLTLSWKFERVDLWVGDQIVAPTGRYTPGANDNVGSGYWGNQVMSGTTVYLTRNKGTTANLFTDWETHGQRQNSPLFHEVPGQAFTMEWGIGQVLPLDKQFSKLLQFGSQR